MQVRPALAVLGVSDPTRLDPYLERRRYQQGERLMAQGTSGDECYLIVAGEVRLEVERPDFDSDGVLAYLGPGMLCGEFSLLDGRPRSASAYAHAEVTALVLTEDGLDRLCADEPATGLAVLRALGRDAAPRPARPPGTWRSTSSPPTSTRPSTRRWPGPRPPRRSSPAGPRTGWRHC